MAKVKVFFGGPRSDIGQHRELAIELLTSMERDGSIELICFDKDTVARASIDAESYLRKVSHCDVALFALGNNPGKVLDTLKGKTTWTLEEWKLAIEVHIPIYLLISHRLDDEILNSEFHETKEIWEFLRDKIPTKHINTFDKAKSYSLIEPVARVITNFISDRITLQEKVSKWVYTASIVTFSRLATDNAVAEIKKATDKIMDDLSKFVMFDAADRNIIQLVAFAYTLRRFSKNPEEIFGLCNAWLCQAWLLLTRTDLESSDIESIAERAQSFYEIKEYCDINMFHLMSPWKQYLAINCLLEMGLMHRYIWKIQDEIVIEHFAEALAKSIKWKEGLSLLRDRFYEIYIAALAYANETEKLQPLEIEIDRLDFPGNEGKGRKFQLQGLCVYLLNRKHDGIAYYQNAICEFIKDGNKWLKNIAHSYVMIAAMRANGENHEKILIIKQECEGQFEELTGENLTKIINTFYFKVWQRTDNYTFSEIWTNK